MKQRKVTIVLRAPFLDRIPSLKNLAIYLADNGCRVTVLSTVDADFPQPRFNNPNIVVKNVAVRTRKLQLPTSVNLARVVAQQMLTDKADIYIGGDELGCAILLKLRRYMKFNFWNFLLEYPDLNETGVYPTLAEADRIITHDRWHSDFLNQNCGTRNEQFLYLPNATFTDGGKCARTHYLADKLGIDHNNAVLLHSGGLGVWFMCKELAEASQGLSEGRTLVFHTSHNTKSSHYFQEIAEAVEQKKLPVRFSLNPVTDEELDTLVGSATIGLAFYSVDKLAYRALNMGVAAGKIGNSLKCGVPVIATRLPSLQYLEDFKAGVLIDDFTQLNDAVDRILADYAEYCEGALRCYADLWEPKAYLAKILKAIESV